MNFISLKTLSHYLLYFSVLLSLGPLSMQAASAKPAIDETMKAVVQHYPVLIHEIYADSLKTAKALKKAIDDLVAYPSQGTLNQAKAAWLAARVPYQQSEVFRFGNAVIDDWEGKVNAWPLDEGLIDYVQTPKESDNPYASANLVANKVLKIAGKTIDANKIDKSLIDALHEAGAVEANVSKGYHAIEFLLWGQDLNGTEAGAGARSYLDYDTKNCTNTDCKRRGDLLKTLADILVDDLKWIESQYSKGGEARREFLALAPKDALAVMLMGMGSLSYGELAGERMKLGLILGDPEEEHDCFSDNTHWSHYYNVKGVANLYHGHYQRSDGSWLSGPGLEKLDQGRLGDVLGKTQIAFVRLVEKAEAGMAYDQLIAKGNDIGNKVIIDAIDALLVQAQAIQVFANTFDIDEIEFEGSGSL